MERYSPEKECVVMTRDQVRAVDAWAINELGIPGVVLMENAGRGCAEFIKGRLDESRRFAYSAEPETTVATATSSQDTSATAASQ
jgi:NAD(P)H-hydrate repair Nnr-like enzyme with NAD(P)H-hydrate epimerase domain